MEFSVIIDENNGIDNEKYVIFREIEGMEELNHLEPTKIYKVNKNQYYINYYKKLNNYIKGGIIEEVKIPKKTKNVNYKKYMKNPNYIDELDGNRKNKNFLLHCFFLSIQKFYDIYKNYQI